MNFCQLRENVEKDHVFKKVVHKAAEAKGEYIGNKIADKIGKPKDVIDKNPRSVKEIIISPKK